MNAVTGVKPLYPRNIEEESYTWLGARDRFIIYSLSTTAGHENFLRKIRDLLFGTLNHGRMLKNEPPPN